MPDYREDGILRNQMLGLGDSGRDIDLHNEIDDTLYEAQTSQQLEALYAKDAIAQKVVSKIPDAAARGGFDLSVGGEPVEADLARAIRKTGISLALSKAAKLSRIYYRGGSVVLDIDDGQSGPATWARAVDKRNIKSVRVAFVADGERIYQAVRSIIQLPPTYYEMSLTDAFTSSLSEDNRSMLEGVSANRIHSDRVLHLDGEWTPPGVEIQLNGTISRLALFWHHYSRYEAAKASAANMLHRSEVLNMKRKGLNMMLAGATAEEEHSLKREAANIRNLANNFGVVVSDMENTEFSVISRNLAHLKELLDEFRNNAIAASGGLSELDIFGLSTQTNGLASNDIRDRIMTAGVVADYQNSELREPLEKFLELLFLAKEGPTNGKPPKNWEIEFPTTLTLTPQEEGALRAQQAETDTKYKAMGLPAELILQNRFGSGRWSGQTELPEDFKIEAPPPAPPSSSNE